MPMIEDFIKLSEDFAISNLGNNVVVCQPNIPTKVDLVGNYFKVIKILNRASSSSTLRVRLIQTDLRKSGGDGILADISGVDEYYVMRTAEIYNSIRTQYNQIEITSDDANPVYVKYIGGMGEVETPNVLDVVGNLNAVITQVPERYKQVLVNFPFTATTLFTMPFSNALIDYRSRLISVIGSINFTPALSPADINLAQFNLTPQGLLGAVPAIPITLNPLGTTPAASYNFAIYPDAILESGIGTNVANIVISLAAANTGEVNAVFNFEYAKTS